MHILRFSCRNDALTSCTIKDIWEPVTFLHQLLNSLMLSSCLLASSQVSPSTWQSPFPSAEIEPAWNSLFLLFYWRSYFPKNHSFAWEQACEVCLSRPYELRSSIPLHHTLICFSQLLQHLIVLLSVIQDALSFEVLPPALHLLQQLHILREHQDYLNVAVGESQNLMELCCSERKVVSCELT